MYSQGYENWYSEQVKFKYDIWKSRILNRGRFGLKIAMCFNFYEIWHLVQIEHANYEYCTWNWWS